MRQKVTLMLLAILFSFGLQAQTGGQVTGKVIDAMGELPGVSVVIKGTSNGTITDLNGQFTLPNVKSSDVLVFSFIGYKTQEITVGNQKSLSVKMEEDTQTLDEVVVVGYQEVRKGDLTGSVAKANMKDLLSAPVASFDQALGGRIAGVNVSSGEGMPGSTMNITIRGNNSLTQDNTPLYIIDGFPVEDPAQAAALNPNDIESTNILKDASATAIYGSRGANGVVVITTKQGKIGKPQISYDGSFGISQVTKTLDMMSGYEFVKLQNEIEPTRTAERYFMDYNGKQWTLDDYRNVPEADWQDAIFRTAWSHNHNLRLTGGTEGVRYNASLSYYNQDGILLETGYERLQARMNTTVKHEKLTMNLNANFSRSIQNGSSPSSSSYSGMNNLFYSVWGYRPVAYPNGSLDDLRNELIDPGTADDANDYRFNPILDLENTYRKNYTNNLQLNGYVQYEFLPGLKLKVTGGWTYDNRHNDIFNNSKTRYGGPRSTMGVNAEVRRSERLTWLNENLLTYQKNWKNRHSLSAMLGTTLQNSDYEYYAYSTRDIPNESLGMAGMSQGTINTTDSSKSSWAMFSYFGNANYNYKSKYYATFSFRADGSSKFSKKNRYGYFPSASLAWSFTEESFMEQYKKWLSSGKLRLSWGLTGNNRIGEYDRYALLDMIRSHREVADIPNTVYPFDNVIESVGVAPISLPNEDLKWETTEQWNLGLDLGFFNERIGFTMDIYRKTTRDLLLDATLPYTSGYVTAMKNIGKVRNQGIELTLNTVNIDKKDFKWSTNFNIAFNKNEVLELTEGQTALLSTAQFDQKFNSQPNYIAKVGYPMGMIYGYIYEGTYKYDDFNKSGNTYTLKGNVPYFSSEANTQPGMPRYKDLNGDGIINSNDRTMIGRGTPIHTGGFTNNFEYKGFDLNIFFQWSYGNDVINANRLFFESGWQKQRELNQYASYANRWTPENPNSDIPAATNSASNLVISSRIVEDASFLRLKSVTLGYNIPQTFLSKYKISNARVYVAAQNLWTWTSYSGYDPEVSIRDSALTPGLDYSSYPRALNISFGINLGF
ncbi:TonB-dependent receptor [Mediterranea massiliensis]|uniref:SusC/RagA family TonB-linked outer membrane protein n=2 Tax=Bacteroidaceae TaxID=815 RepID=UPI0025A3B61F|nr:TonB-dependent receptor [Mediterranea massiliensis]MDM8336061.1 TonB-dependent receptor [Mediterranea massiliensis]